jgi:hypothetical protein
MVYRLAASQCPAVARPADGRLPLKASGEETRVRIVELLLDAPRRRDIANALGVS